MASLVAPVLAPGAAIDAEAVLDALAEATLVVGPDGVVCYANAATEQLFGTTGTRLCGRSLGALVPEESPVFAALAQARHTDGPVTAHDIALDAIGNGIVRLTLHVAALAHPTGAAVLSFRLPSLARHLDAQESQRESARALGSLAAALAHELRNPLSGIRGAAQLLEQGADDADGRLARLIREETDRIVGLVERFDAFAEDRPPPRGPVNVHQVLDHVRALAAAGFANGVPIEAAYDPSLPPALASRDLLVQVMLNLVKNAVEASPGGTARVVLRSAYEPDVRLRGPDGATRAHLPLVLGVANEGPAIPEDVRGRLFEPFVTTKPAGRGLGLALVAKLVGDLGGAVDFETEAGRTEFRVRLAVSDCPGDTA